MTTAVRPVESDADLALAVEIYNRVVPARAQTEREVREYVELVPDHVYLLGLLDGEPRGVGFAGVEAAGRPLGLGSVVLAVLPDARGRGLGSRLLGAVAAWGREHGVTALHGSIEETEPDALAWAERRGFPEVARESKLVLELSEIEAPVPAAPKGIEIATLAARPDLVRGLYDVAYEAVPDIPGNEDEPVPPFEEWLREDLQGPSDRPEAIFVALAGDEVVGYSKFHLPEARPTVALHDLTGVKRAWRGRGIAGALKQAQIAWAKKAGYERLETMNELRNVPIRRLNERFGYREAPGEVLVRGPLPD